MTDLKRYIYCLEVADGCLIMNSPIPAARHMGAALENTDDSASMFNDDLSLRAPLLQALWSLEMGDVPAAKGHLFRGLREAERRLEGKIIV